VGIQIPPGDVGDLKRAATLHAQLADELGHGQLTLVHSSFQLATAWEGAAAKAYSEYSAHVSARYGDASDQAREIAHLLKGWAGALEEDQARSRKLLGEGEETAKRIDAGEAALRRDRSVLASHERALAAAKAEPRTVLTAELVDSQVRACEALVTTWTHTVAAEVKALAGLREDLESLQREATRVYEAAEELASRHNAYLSNISVIAPAPAQVPAGSPVQPLAAVPAVAGLASSSISESAGSDPASFSAPTDVPLDLTPVSSGATQGAITFGDLEKIGNQYGWSKAQDQAWWQVIKLESGGNPAATNPSSGAYGIGQFLGGTLKEYAPYGAASPNPLDQLNAMARYIHDRYGTPDAALTFHLANNWY
jgi:colicin import membrane protein